MSFRTQRKQRVCIFFSLKNTVYRLPVPHARNKLFSAPLIGWHEWSRIRIICVPMCTRCSTALKTMQQYLLLAASAAHPAIMQRRPRRRNFCVVLPQSAHLAGEYRKTQILFKIRAHSSVTAHTLKFVDTPYSLFVHDARVNLRMPFFNNYCDLFTSLLTQRLQVLATTVEQWRIHRYLCRNH